MDRPLALLALLALAGCQGPESGTEVGNPDLTSDLRAQPQALGLAPTCAGGTARASVLLVNEGRWDVDAMAGGDAGEEAFPSSFEVQSDGARELVVVIPVPTSSASGTIEVLHRREGVSPDEEDRLLEIPWWAAAAADAPTATVLCGEELPCAVVDFGSVTTEALWQMPLEVVNDGCAPLRIERIEAEGSGAEVAGPALPATLQPGERWPGRLLLRPAALGAHTGSVAVASDDAQRREQRVLWSANAIR